MFILYYTFWIYWVKIYLLLMKNFSKKRVPLLHHRNLLFLLCYVYGYSPLILKQCQSSINLRQTPAFYSSSVSSVNYGKNLLSFLEKEIWELVYLEIRNPNWLNDLERKSKHWKPTACLCKFGINFIKSPIYNKGNTFNCIYFSFLFLSLYIIRFLF